MGITSQIREAKLAPVKIVTEVHLWELVLGASVFVGVLASIWDKGFIRIYHFAKGTVKTLEAHPILVEIAEQFKPNHGTSLYDVIMDIRAQQSKHATMLHEYGEDLTDIKRILEDYVADLQPGGRRHSDP